MAGSPPAEQGSALEQLFQALGELHRYHRRVFMVPPWPEIYRTDAERRHGFEDSLPEYYRLETVSPAFGYDVITLPKVAVATRADFVLATLAT